jgi:hypothetical protein
MSQWFAPTQMVLTFEREGQGHFTQEEIEKVVVRNKAGHVVALRLPNKHVLISNHQVHRLFLISRYLLTDLFTRSTPTGGTSGV